MERNNKDFILMTPNYTAEIFGPCFPCEKIWEREKGRADEKGKKCRLKGKVGGSARTHYFSTSLSHCPLSDSQDAGH